MIGHSFIHSFGQISSFDVDDYGIYFNRKSTSRFIKFFWTWI